MNEDEMKNKPIYLRMDMNDHLTLQRIGVQAPDDLNERQWRVGDTLTFTVVGVTVREVTEGLEVR